MAAARNTSTGWRFRPSAAANRAAGPSASSSTGIGRCVRPARRWGRGGYGRVEGFVACMRRRVPGWRLRQTFRVCRRSAEWTAHAVFRPPTHRPRGGRHRRSDRVALPQRLPGPAVPSVGHGALGRGDGRRASAPAGRGPPARSRVGDRAAPDSGTGVHGRGRRAAGGLGPSRANEFAPGVDRSRRRRLGPSPRLAAVHRRADGDAARLDPMVVVLGVLLAAIELRRAPIGLGRAVHRRGGGRRGDRDERDQTHRRSGPARPQPCCGRPRPIVSERPFGHTPAWAFYACAVLLLGCRRSRATRAVLTGAAVGVAVAVASSRVLLDVHWVTDVIAGLVLGWAWFAICGIAFGGRIVDFGVGARVAERAASRRRTAVRARGGLPRPRRGVAGPSPRG